MNRSCCGYIWLFALLVSYSIPANADLCPKSPTTAVNEYYSAVRRVDLLTLETLTGGKEWIRREQIAEMSRRLDTFKVVSVKKIARNDKGSPSSVYIRVREHWKNPNSHSFGYFTAVPTKGCWGIEDFGTEE
jgi:hypothetical protein